jgi:murein DD-endopeptidase MepM/ murein hydrolase activator NlpD
MHLQSAPPVDVGDRVEAGERIGRVGRSGNASACHLHFETWTAPGWFRGGKARDPRPALERWARAAKP